jgi:hypothetical protein
LPQPPPGDLHYTQRPLPAVSVSNKDGKTNTRAAQRS